jgi:hypothetical protein
MDKNGDERCSNLLRPVWNGGMFERKEIYVPHCGRSSSKRKNYCFGLMGLRDGYVFLSLLLSLYHAPMFLPV